MVYSSDPVLDSYPTCVLSTAVYIVADWYGCSHRYPYTYGCSDSS